MKMFLLAALFVFLLISIEGKERLDESTKSSKTPRLKSITKPKKALKITAKGKSNIAKDASPKETSNKTEKSLPEEKPNTTANALPKEVSKMNTDTSTKIGEATAKPEVQKETASKTSQMLSEEVANKSLEVSTNGEFIKPSDGPIKEEVEPTSPSEDTSNKTSENLTNDTTKLTPGTLPKADVNKTAKALPKPKANKEKKVISKEDKKTSDDLPMEAKREEVNTNKTMQPLTKEASNLTVVPVGKETENTTSEESPSEKDNKTLKAPKGASHGQMDPPQWETSIQVEVLPDERSTKTPEAITAEDSVTATKYNKKEDNPPVGKSAVRTSSKPIKEKLAGKPKKSVKKQHKLNHERNTWKQ